MTTFQFRNNDAHRYGSTCRCCLAEKTLAATPEQSLALIRNQILNKAINVAWNHEPDCNGPIEMALRKLKEPE